MCTRLATLAEKKLGVVIALPYASTLRQTKDSMQAKEERTVSRKMYCCPSATPLPAMSVPKRAAVHNTTCKSTTPNVIHHADWCWTHHVFHCLHGTFKGGHCKHAMLRFGTFVHSPESKRDRHNASDTYLEIADK